MTWALLVGMPWGDPVVDVARRSGGTVFRCGCTDTDQCAGFSADLRGFRLVVTVAWRHLVPRRVIERSTVVGFHSAKLPEYPGRAPVPWAILRGDRVTENTMLYLVDEPDAGPIIDRRRVLVTTASATNRRMGRTAAVMLRQHLPDLVAGHDLGVPQDRSLRGPLTRADGWAFLAERERLATGHA